MILQPETPLFATLSPADFDPDMEFWVTPLVPSESQVFTDLASLEFGFSFWRRALCDLAEVAVNLQRLSPGQSLLTATDEDLAEVLNTHYCSEEDYERDHAEYLKQFNDDLSDSGCGNPCQAADAVVPNSD